LTQIIPPDVATGPALDIPAGKIYWVTSGPASLKRANLDGSNVETLIASFNATFPKTPLILVYTDAQLPPTPTPTPTSTATPTDTPTPSPTPTITPTPLPTPTPGGPPPAENVYWSSLGGELLYAPVAGCSDGTCIQAIVTPSPGTSAGDLDVDSINGKIYWINPVDGSIQSSDLDGSNVETLLTGLTDPMGIAVDVLGERIYWTDFTNGTIQRAAIDGTLVETVVSGLTHPVWIDLDNTNRLAYFVESDQTAFSSGTSKIRRISLDGAPDLTDLYVNGSYMDARDNEFYPLITGFAVDEEGGRLYWSEVEIGEIGASRIRWLTTDTLEIGVITPFSNVVEDGDLLTWSGPTFDRNSFKLYWGEGVLPFDGNFIAPPYTMRSSPPDGTISGGTIITTTQNLTDGVHNLALQYPSPTPPACTPDDFEPDDDFGSAVPVTVGTPSLNHSFHNDGDADWYQFALTAGFVYGILALAEDSEADTVLELYAADGTTLLDSNDNAAPDVLDSQVTFAPVKDTTYYARVTNNTTSFETRCNSSYGLRVNFSLPDPPPPLTDTLPAGHVPPVIDSAVLTPTAGSLLASLGATTIAGSAYSDLDSMSVVTVTVNGAFLAAPAPGPDGDWSTAAWSPVAEGKYRLESVALDVSGNVQTDTHPITVSVDLAPPSITLDRTVFTQTHAAGTSQVELSGTATDSNGIGQTELRLAGGVFQGVNVSGTIWIYPWTIGVDPDGGVTQANARATDLAGRSTTITETITVDILGPMMDLIRPTHQSGITPTLLVEGDSVHEANPTLAVNWPAASDGSGLAGYFAGYTTSPTATKSLLTFYAAPGAGQHLQVMGEAEIVYGHLIAVDTLGNHNSQTIGPIYVDGPATPDLIGDLDYLGWLDSGGSQLGADREFGRGPMANPLLDQVQRFYMTWDDTALRMVWEGADLAAGGDLFIYLDTAGGGATRLYDPYAGTTAIDLPTGMAADYVIWVQDDVTADLLQYSGSAWSTVMALGPANFRHQLGTLPLLADIYLPFNLLGISNGSSLGLLAVASEDDALRLWAAAPDKNPLNSELAINPSAAGRDLTDFDLTLYHQWANLSLGQIPNDGRFADSDLQLSIESEVNSVAVGYLASDLLDLLVPGTPLDGDEDGEIDVSLPGSMDPNTVGHDQLLNYTIQYHNGGSETAESVIVNLAGSTALDVSGNPSINLGDIGPGEAGAVEFTALVNGPSAASAELQATLGDGAHGDYEWFWFQHDVDTEVPTEIQVGQPLTYFLPFGQTVAGQVVDASAVPTITLEFQLTDDIGSLTIVTSCTDPTPRDGLWSCPINLGSLTNVNSVRIRAGATDGHGNESAYGAPVFLLVDVQPPAVTLHAEVEDALADGFVNAAEALLGGTVSDNRQASQIEICTLEADDLLTCETKEVMPGDTASGTWSLLLLTADRDGEPQTLRLTGIDGARNVSDPLTRTFKIDTVPPALTITHALDEVEFDDYRSGAPPAAPVISGTVSDGGGLDRVTVRLEAPNGAVTYQDADVNGDTWQFAPELGQGGDHTLTVEAYDLAGNGGAAAHELEVIGGESLIYIPMIVKQTTGQPAPASPSPSGGLGLWMARAVETLLGQIDSLQEALLLSSQLYSLLLLVSPFIVLMPGFSETERPDTEDKRKRRRFG
jgi:hypothetical protein